MGKTEKMIPATIRKVSRPGLSLSAAISMNISNKAFAEIQA
jgi:hypothetical protein